MTKLLVFLVLCIASASCVKLENLCSSDHFEYNGVLVNAFYKSPMNVTFPSLRHYLIDGSFYCDLNHFGSRYNYFKVLRAKSEFNRKFAGFYTNDLKDATSKDFEDKCDELRNDWKVLNQVYKVEPRPECIRIGLRKISSDSKPSNSEAVVILGELFEKLNNAGDGKTFALKGEKASDVFYKKRVVLPKEFLTDGSIQPDTERVFIFEQYLPFNSHQHTDEGCVPVEQLPMFYKNKGKE